jgi:RimJ/RimL family protein N-acetyltransferase
VILVRAASTDDLEAVEAIYLAAWKAGFREVVPSTVFYEDDFDDQRRVESHDIVLDDRIETCVAELDGHIIGFVGTATTDRRSMIVAMWVTPQAWGRGASNALLASVEQSAHTAGIHELTAWVPEDAPRARRVLERASWRPSGNIGVLNADPSGRARTFHYCRRMV